MTLTPAYGKDYKSKKSVQEAFDNNVDFIIADMFHPYSGKPVNKSQLKGSVCVAEVGIRFDKLRKIQFFKV
jgi:hypothetical protein